MSHEACVMSHEASVMSHEARVMSHEVWSRSCDDGGGGSGNDSNTGGRFISELRRNATYKHRKRHYYRRLVASPSFVSSTDLAMSRGD